MSAQERNCSGRLSIIERYRELLSVDEETPVISLQEGDTPLLRAGNLEAHFEKLTGSAPDIEIWLKYDGACLLYTSPSPRDLSTSRMPSSA